MLDIPPAIDLPEDRAEAAVGGVHPIFQRAHRAGAEGCDASHGDDTFGTRCSVEDEVDAGFVEANLLDVETDQCRSAEPGGGQQQQSPIAQAGEIAGASARHASEMDCSGRERTPARRGAAGLPQQRRHLLVGRR
jgi:hypothetical protein